MPETYDKYFLSYSGVQLPLQLVGELSPDEVENRNTFFGVRLDTEGRVVLLHKCVYGAVDLEHRYEYHADGSLARAIITNPDDDDEDERTRVISWPQGVN